MWKVTLIYLAILALTLTNANPVKISSSWWDNSIMYQIYPRSFKDSDNDGIGDLNGITSKLEHVREFADIVWLSPIYTSPQHDFGYDISNFTDVHYEYGTLEDFDELVAKAKSLGLKLILDLVPNHSSDEHEWFKKSVKRIKPYDDYYIWKDAKISPDGKRLPPNNWLSMFTGSAWEWNEERQQYYYHQFLTSQPDLNYNNPYVRQEMENVITFWLDRGVDGFRVDAIAHLFEDPFLKDEPRSKANVPSDDYSYLEHVYTRDLDETYEVVHSWRKLMDEHSRINETPEKIAFMEIGAADIPHHMKYYKVGTDPMNFGFVSILNNDSTVGEFKENIDSWMNSMPKDMVANWIVGNHDVHRVASRFGYDNNRADEISMLSAVLPGMMVLYNGDEIGMLDRFFTYEETVDPAGCNAGPDRYQVRSRDPQRTPYQWDDTTSAGFSTNPKTWLPVNENYKILNLAAQKEAVHSHYKIIKALSELRSLPIMMRGSSKVFNLDDKVLVVSRRLPMWEPVALLTNFDTEDVVVDATTWLHGSPKEMAIYVASMKSGYKGGEIINLNEIIVPGTSSIVIASTRLVSALSNNV